VSDRIKDFLWLLFCIFVSMTFILSIVGGGRQ